MTNGKVLLIVNTGTPDNPGVRAVGRYLSEFLNDPFVIDLPWLARKMLVNFIIVPFRVRHSAKLYSRLWTPDGSPLKVNLDKLVAKLETRLKNRYTVIGAMRYGNPSIKSAFQQIDKDSEVIVLPLFPQFASSTTGSVKNAVLKEAASLKMSQNIRFIDQFFSDVAFIEAFASTIMKYSPEKFDHVLFSYHSLPVSHLLKLHPEQNPGKCTCSSSFPSFGLSCYKAQCYHTSRLIARRLNLDEEKYSTSFQSRMSRNWIGPFTDKVLADLPGKGRKKVLVAAPSFVADCLETLIEIKEQNMELFHAAGGENFFMSESLNYSDIWIEALAKIVD